VAIHVIQDDLPIFFFGNDSDLESGKYWYWLW